MKINIKLTADQVFYLKNKLEAIATLTASEYVRLSRQKKNENSLLIDCFDKLEAKLKKIQREVSIFNSNKKYSITFKYHEASILNMLACNLKDSEIRASYSENMANSIYLIIDKQI